MHQQVCVLRLSKRVPFERHHSQPAAKVSTCQGHLIGHPVNGQHSLGAIITGLNEKLLWGGVPERTKTTFRASPTTWKMSKPLNVTVMFAFQDEKTTFSHKQNSGEINIYTAAFTPLFETRGILIQINKAVKTKDILQRAKVQILQMS